MTKPGHGLWVLWDFALRQSCAAKLDRVRWARSLGSIDYWLLGGKPFVSTWT